MNSKIHLGLFIFSVGSLFLRCNAEEQVRINHTNAHSSISEVELKTDTLPAHVMFFYFNPEFKSDGFDYPVGAPNAKNYYNAQPFGKNNPSLKEELMTLYNQNNHLFDEIGSTEKIKKDISDAFVNFMKSESIE